MNKFLGLHETLETLEILSFKNLCQTKAFTMSKLVQDTELQDILNKNVETDPHHIQRLQELLTK